jgi:hypothetical protein
MRRQALLLRHRGKQTAQGAVLLRVKPGGEPKLVLARELGKLAQQTFAGRCEVEGVQPAIVGVAATLDVATFFELVDVYDDAAGQHTKLNAEGLLAAAGLGGDGAQDSRVWRAQLDRGHPLGELRRGVMAELSQQEGHAIGVFASWG